VPYPLVGHFLFQDSIVLRHIRWQILLTATGLILAAVLLSYQAGGMEEVSVPASGGRLVEGVAGWPRYLNPLISFGNPVDRDICALVFEGLTRFNERGRLEPALATGWNVSLDGLVYTFWLRQNALWQDGIGFSADDVLFTIGLIQDQGYPGPPDLAALWRTVRVEKINQWTVTFTLQEPYSPFLEYTTIGILPAHRLEDLTGARLTNLAFNRQPVGIGRFKVASSNWDDGRLLLTVNPLYWDREKPRLQEIEFRFYPDYDSVLASYEAGEIHSMGNIQRADIARAESFENVNLFTSSLPRYTAVLLNLHDDALPFFQDRSVRQALLYGLNRPALIADVLEGQGTIAHSPIAPGSWAYFGDVKRYDYDAPLAAEMLDAAGWLLPDQGEQGTGLVESEALREGVRLREDQELSFTLLAIANSTHEAVARALSASWAKLGIRATVQTVPADELFQALGSGDFAAALVDIDMQGDPDLYAFWSESAIREGQNYAGWRHRQASEILEQARQLNNVEQRTTLYYHFQQIFAEEMPALLLYYHTYTYGISGDVQNVSMGPLTEPSDRFATVSDWFLVWREVIIRRTSP
jgi:peptide/nickel transport system substrate-binding protein